jgi:hypothetical protein
VSAPAGQPLEALVRDELRGPIAELVQRVVRELVAEQLNGAAPVPVETSVALRVNGAAPSTKVCTLCGETKPSSAFNTGRRQCRQCRNARYPRNHRVRGAVTTPAVDEEPPRTSAAESGSET